VYEVLMTLLFTWNDRNDIRFPPLLFGLKGVDANFIALRKIKVCVGRLGWIGETAARGLPVERIAALSDLKNRLLDFYLVRICRAIQENYSTGCLNNSMDFAPLKVPAD
jgi:hypothetical protein